MVGTSGKVVPRPTLITASARSLCSMATPAPGSLFALSYRTYL